MELKFAGLESLLDEDITPIVTHMNTMQVHESLKTVPQQTEKLNMEVTNSASNYKSTALINNQIKNCHTNTNNLVTPVAKAVPSTAPTLITKKSIPLKDNVITNNTNNVRNKRVIEDTQPSGNNNNNSQESNYDEERGGEEEDSTPNSPVINYTTPTVNNNNTTMMQQIKVFM